MSVTPKTTLIGMYVFDHTLFDQITLPAEVDKNIFVNCLLLEKGECPVLYQDIDFNKNAFGIWASKWYHSIDRLAAAFSEAYNPLHNFDRHEEYSDVEGIDRNGTSGDTIKTTADMRRNTSESGGNSTERKVSAYNEDTYQPDSIDTNTNNNDSSEESEANTDVSSEGKRSESEDRTLTHTGHLYGNIGVTKSQEMLLDELHLRSAHNIYDVVVQMFANEFLIPIY